MSDGTDPRGLAERCREVREMIAEAARGAGRDPDEITLVAVSKKHPAEAVSALYGAGQLDFGENYVQEALAKVEEVGQADIRWHFIGGLQSNKAKLVAGRFHLVHTVDSLKLAQTLHKSALAAGAVQEVLLQVNLAGEAQKRGAPPESVPELARQAADLPGLKVSGLMIMPPFMDDPEESRPYFAGLRKLRDDLERELGMELPHLSMGMTNDFRQAVEEGADLVRVGTRIFGPREH